MKENESYTLIYTPANYIAKQFWRKLALAIAVLCDIVNFFVFISAFGDPLLFIAVFTIALLATLLRIFAGKLPYTVTYGLENGNFFIRRAYPLSNKAVSECAACQIEGISQFTAADTDTIIYADISCQEGLYVVKLNGRKYVLYFDLYMYSLLKELIK